MFYPWYVGRTVRIIRLCAVPLSADMDCVLATVLLGVEDYRILSLKVTRTQLYWAHSMEADILIEREEECRITEIIGIEDARDLCVIISGRRMRCNWCLNYGQFQKTAKCLNGTGEEWNRIDALEKKKDGEVDSDNAASDPEAVVEEKGDNATIERT